MRSTRAASSWTTVTLHVGPGTFLPVKTDDPREHRMHAEWGVLIAPRPPQRIDAVAAARGGRIVAVGTTSLRLLESAAAQSGEVRPFAGETRLFILPGYRFRAIDLLLTNFHLPRSTLFMLVAALAGLDRIKSAYAHAIARRLPLLLLRRRLPDRARRDDLGFEVLGARRRGAARPDSRPRMASIETPVFMPVGTAGTVKAMTPRGRRRDRRADPARQHLSPDAAAGRRAHRRARRACTVS